MYLTSEKKRVVAAIDVAAKKDQAKEKKARDTTALVTTGSEKRLEQLGPSELLRLKINELHALLVNADHEASIPKPDKKIGQEKANLMPTVQAALRRYLAVASVQATPVLQVPEAPLICEGENILNMQIEGLLEMFMPISDPVFPYATDASADDEVPAAYA